MIKKTIGVPFPDNIDYMEFKIDGMDQMDKFDDIFSLAFSKKNY